MNIRSEKQRRNSVTKPTGSLRGARGALCALGLMLSLSTLGAMSAYATPIPIPDTPLLGGTGLEKMDRGFGENEYQMQIIGSEFQSGWSDIAGDRLRIDYRFTSNAPSDAETLVVFTSVRFGTAPLPVTCADLAPGSGVDLKEANFDFVTDPSSAQGNFNRVVTSTDDRSDGGLKAQICFEEPGANLFSLVLDAAPAGTAFDFSVEIFQTKDDIAAEEWAGLTIMGQAYRAVPEPGTGLLVLGGLIALSRVSRQRTRG